MEELRKGAVHLSIGLSSAHSNSVVLLILSVLLMVPGADSQYLHQNGPSPKVICPITEDISQTKHGFLINHFKERQDNSPEHMLGCDWLQESPDEPTCHSISSGFELLRIEKDHVVANVSRAQLPKGGFYVCQLLPPDSSQPFTPCLVYINEDAKPAPEVYKYGSAIMAVTERHQSQSQTEKAPICADVRYITYTQELVAAVAVLSTILIILILLIVVFFTLYRRGITVQLLPRSSESQKPQKQTRQTNGYVSAPQDITA